MYVDTVWSPGEGRGILWRSETEEVEGGLVRSTSTHSDQNQSPQGCSGQAARLEIFGTSCQVRDIP